MIAGIHNGILEVAMHEPVSQQVVVEMKTPVVVVLVKDNVAAVLPIEVSVEDRGLDVLDSYASCLTFAPFSLQCGLKILGSGEKPWIDTKPSGWIANEQSHNFYGMGEATILISAFVKM